jgi:ADP-ribose pyrophosphatase
VGDSNRSRKTPKLLRETVLLEEYGKVISRRTFRDPRAKKSAKYLVWGGTTMPVIVFPVTVDHKVILVEQFRRGANDWVLELPGGLPKPGQSFTDTACAELKEETGYSPRWWVALIAERPIWFEPAAATTPFVAVLATGCQLVDKQKLDEGEVIKRVHTVAIPEFKRMCRDGEVRDSKTLAIAFLALMHLGV